MHQLQLTILSIVGSIITYFTGIFTGILPAGIVMTIVTTIIISSVAFLTNYFWRWLLKVKDREKIDNNEL